MRPGAESSRPPGGRRILLVDEEPDASRLEAALTGAGFNVRICDEASVALGVAKAIEPDLIIADYDLPEESGDWLARSLRRLHAAPPAQGTTSSVAWAPFMLLCNPRNARARISKPTLGADLCKMKPLAFPEIVAETSRLLAMRDRLVAMRGALPALGNTAGAFSAPITSDLLTGALTLLDLEARSGTFEIATKEGRVQLRIGGGRVLLSAVNGANVDAASAVTWILAAKIGTLEFTPFAPTEVPADAPALGDLLAAKAPGTVDLVATQVYAQRSSEPPTPEKSAPQDDLPAELWRPIGLSASELDGSSPMELADLLLLTCTRARGDVFLRLEPGPSSYAVAIDQPGGGFELEGFQPSIGQAIAARLMFLADLDVTSGDEQIGRIRARGQPDGATREILVLSHATPDGPGIELKRIPGLSKNAANGPTTDEALLEQHGVYKMVRELGRGGMGVVYLVEHMRLKRPFALKLLHRELAAQPEVAARFVREGHASARARHPNIVDVTDFGVLGDGRAFLVMEVVEGTTLESMLASGKGIEALRAIKIGVQVALALHAAHETGVIHRDVKPSNVFVDQDDHVKLGDFGIAKFAEFTGANKSATAAGMVLGTPLYMSPEQVGARGVDHRSDIYALGCVLFEMLTGAPPFDGTSEVIIMSKHLTAPLPPIKSALGPLPADLEEVVKRALAKEPDDRYFTARQLATHLGWIEERLLGDSGASRRSDARGAR